LQRQSEIRPCRDPAAGNRTNDGKNCRRNEMTVLAAEPNVARSTHTRSKEISDRANSIAPVADSIAANAFAGMSPEKHQFMATVSRRNAFTSTGSGESSSQIDQSRPGHPLQTQGLMLIYYAMVSAVTR